MANREVTSTSYVTEVDGTLKSRSIVFGDPDTCNITIRNSGGGSQMTITLPENFGRKDASGAEITTQTYDMRSVIEAIMELNRRTAFMGSNCSFLKAIEKHQTTDETTDDPDSQFSANTTADGLPAARNGTYDMASDIDGTVITTESINTLRDGITELTNQLNTANALISELSANYESLYEATRIKSFEFTVTFNSTSYVAYSSSIEGIQSANRLYATEIVDGTGTKYVSKSTGNIKSIPVSDIFNNDVMTILHDHHPLQLELIDSSKDRPLHRLAVLNTNKKKERAARFMLGTYSNPAVIAFPYIHIDCRYKSPTDDDEQQFNIHATDIPQIDDKTTSLMGVGTEYGIVGRTLTMRILYI